MNTRQVIGWNLRRLRVAKGLSQERLALQSNIDRAYVGRVERGQENVTVNKLDAMAEVLGVKVAELFTDPGSNWAMPAALKSGRKPKVAKPGV
jgi:transcriptional regulator with XRE-family HTH domain